MSKRVSPTLRYAAPLLALLLPAVAVFGQVQLPIVTTPGGAPTSTQGVVCVDLTGEYPCGVVTSTQELEAVDAGNACLASTGMLPVNAGQTLHVTFMNPVGQPDIVLTERIFSTTSSTALEYQVYANPSVELSTTAVSVNRLVGAPNCAAVFKYQAASSGTIVMGGAQGSGEAIPADGVPRERRLPVILPAGQSLGFTVSGSGGGIPNAARIAITLQWYARP